MLPSPWGRSPVSFEQISQLYFSACGSWHDLAHLLRAVLLQGGWRYGPAIFRGCCPHHGAGPLWVLSGLAKVHFSGKSWDKGPRSQLPQVCKGGAWLVAHDMIWHIYSLQHCFIGDGAIHLPSSGEVLLGLGKVPCETGKDQTKHWGSYPWDVCQGPRPLKSELGRMEQWNVVSSYVCISELLSKPLFHWYQS